MSRFLVYLLIAALPLSVCPSVQASVIGIELHSTAYLEEAPETRSEEESEVLSRMVARRRALMLPRTAKWSSNHSSEFRTHTGPATTRCATATCTAYGHCWANNLRAPLRT